MSETTVRREDNQITDTLEIERILDEQSVLRLAVVDGTRPYCVPLSFAREGEDLWMHTAAEGGRLLGCLRRNPEVCIEADHFIGLKRGPLACDCSGRYESVIGFGVAEIVEEEQAKLRAFRTMMRKYSGREDWEFSAELLSRAIVICVHLRALTAKHQFVKL